VAALGKEVEKKPAEYRAPCESSIWRMILSPTVAMTKFMPAIVVDVGIRTIDRQNDKTGFSAIRHGDVAGAAIDLTNADGSAELPDFSQRQQLLDHNASVRVIVAFGWCGNLHGRLP
jgi:hypothetical protein